MLYVLPLQDLLLLSLRTAGFNLLTVVGSCWGHCKSVLDLATSPFTSWARSSDHFLCAGGRIHCFVAVSFALAVTLDRQLVRAASDTSIRAPDGHLVRGPYLRLS